MTRMIEVSEDALDSIKKMAEQVQKERDEAFKLLVNAKILLDRYRLETPIGNQPHMITLEAYECSNAIAAMQTK